MSKKPVANRPPAAGRMLPPIVAATGKAKGQSLVDRAIRDIRQEQTYSRRLLDNERQQVCARYERLKKKASQIRSNLTPEQIAEIQRGMEGGAEAEYAAPDDAGGGEGSGLGVVPPPEHGARLTAQPGRRILLGVTGATAGLAGAKRASVGAPAAHPMPAHQAELSIAVPTPVAMDHKRVHMKTSKPAKPGLKAAEDASIKKLPPVHAPTPPPTHSRSPEEGRQVDDSTVRHLTSSPSKPTAQSAAPGALAKLKEEDTKKNRAATFTLSASSTSGSSSGQDEPDAVELFSRPRSCSAAGRLQSIPANSPNQLPTVTEEVGRVCSPGRAGQFTPPLPPSRPRSSTGIAPSTHQLSPEPRGSPRLHNRRTGRSVTAVAPFVVLRPGGSSGGHQSTHQPGSPTVRSPVASAEPPATFSCHEPRLEDVLSRLPSSVKVPAVIIRRRSTAVSPFQESRARRREELREARIDDNELLAVALEHRKERLMKGLEDITWRPQEDDRDETPQVASPGAESDSSSSPPFTSSEDQRVDVEPGGGGPHDPTTTWHQEMMKIRYLRLPKDYEEAITDDTLALATAQHKAGSQIQREKIGQK